MSLSKIRVAKSAITDHIFAGRITKNGLWFKGEKYDVTSDVLRAVVDFVTPGHLVEVSVNGKIKYTITVAEVNYGASIGADVSGTAESETAKG